MNSIIKRYLRYVTAGTLCSAMLLMTMTGCKSQEPSLVETGDESTSAPTELTASLATTTESQPPTATPTPVMPRMNPPEVDTTAPFFLNLPETVYVKVGDDFDIDKQIGYIDNCDAEVELTVDGEVDTSTAGKYPLNLTLTDDAGNTKTGSLTVSVYVPSNNGGGGGGDSGHKTLAFSDFMARYPGEDIAYGIDVSRYQGDIDFNKVKAAGCDFVYLRAMIYNNGELGVDKKFEEYYRDAKAAGLVIGVYYFSTDCTSEELQAHSAELLKVLEGKEIDLPIAFDWESWNHFQKYKMSIVDLNNLFYEFAWLMKANNYETILYGSKYYLESIWEPAGYDVWMAHYVKETDYAGNYTIWQTGSIGRIDGVPEDCDTDILFKSKYPDIFGG